MSACSNVTDLDSVFIQHIIARLSLLALAIMRHHESENGRRIITYAKRCRSNVMALPENVCLIVTCGAIPPAGMVYWFRKVYRERSIKF
jgi:hypothetical protein